MCGELMGVGSEAARDRKQQEGKSMVEDLTNRFTYHSPRADQPRRYRAIRQNALDFAETLAAWAPASRELDLAIQKVEEAVFWANAAIARNEHETPAEVNDTDQGANAADKPA